MPDDRCRSCFGPMRDFALNDWRCDWCGRKPQGVDPRSLPPDEAAEAAKQAGYGN